MSDIGRVVRVVPGHDAYCTVVYAEDGLHLEFGAGGDACPEFAGAVYFENRTLLSYVHPCTGRGDGEGGDSEKT